jgi:hypothetical protein
MCQRQQPEILSTLPSKAVQWRNFPEAEQPFLTAKRNAYRMKQVENRTTCPMIFADV